MFTVTIDGIPYDVPITQLREFLSKAFSRQRGGKSPFSRNYWMQTHRPKFDRTEYDAIMTLLTGLEGLVINRSEKRSGKLVMPPEATIRALQGAF